MTQELVRPTARLTLAQRALIETPDARKLVARTVIDFRRHYSRYDSAEVESLANDALVEVALVFKPGAASFATFARKHVYGYVLRGLKRDARARLPRIEAILRTYELLSEPASDAIATAQHDHLEARRRLLRRQARLATELALRVVGSLDPETALTNQEERRLASSALHAALAELSHHEAQFVRRHYFEHATLRVIARELECSYDSVKRLNDRVRAQLRAALVVRGVLRPPEIE